MKKPFLVLIVMILSVSWGISSASGAFSDRSPCEITITCRGDLDRLAGLGIDIDRVSANTVGAYLSPDERTLVSLLGFCVVMVDDSERTAHDRYVGKTLKSALYYPDYNGVTSRLSGFASGYPGLCRVVNAGESVQGRHLWYLTVTARPGAVEAEPVISLVGTLHGNEPVGMVLLLEFAGDLLSRYGVDDRITRLLDSTEIRIMPLANPDGYEAGDRYNAHGVDLNRNFPDPSPSSGDGFDTGTGREPETRAIMAWELLRPSALSANFHAGSLLVNYPFDYTYEKSPDDDLLRFISVIYSQYNTPMYTGAYEEGVVRGAEWYVIYGGLQDWSYLASGSNHVTVELSTVKFPEPEALEGLWNDNRDSLLAYVETVLTGIGGIVTDADTGEPIRAWISIAGNDHRVFSDTATGYYQRMLLPGTYTMTVGADGYLSETIRDSVVVPDHTTRQDVGLRKGDDGSEKLPMTDWPDKDNGVTDDSVTGAASGGGCYIESVWSI
jgi:carboxypeptidase D